MKPRGALLLSTLLPAVAAAGLQASFDLLLFQSGCSEPAPVRAEVCYLIDRSDITFVETDSGAFGAYQAWLEVLAADSVVFASGWERYDKLLPGQSVSVSQKIPDLEAACLSPGAYELRATVQDKHSGALAREEWRLTVDAPATDRPCLSSVLLMARPPQSAAATEFFHRYGRLIVPYADAIFGEELPELHYYLEASTAGCDTLWLEVRVLGQDRQLLFTADTLQLSATAFPQPLTGKLAVDRLPSGSYYLQLAALPAQPLHWLMPDNGERKFFVFNPGVTGLPPEYLAASSLDSWSDSDSLDLLEVFQQLRPLVPSQEERRFRQLNCDGMRSFLSSFWLERDPTPGTPINEARASYNVRLEYVTHSFRTSLLEGWETDMGRVYLKYGAPDNRERHSFSNTGEFSRNPDRTDGLSGFGETGGFNRQLSGEYELWFYDTLEGGVYFVFVDRHDLGDFILVHSTKSGEIQNYNWEQQL